jgi:hypothetical protein
LLGLFGGLGLSLGCEVGDALLEAGDGVLIVGDDFAACRVTCEAVNALLMRLDEDLKLLGGVPVELFKLLFALPGLEQLRMKGHAALLDSARRGDGGVVLCVPDVRDNDCAKNDGQKRKREREGENSFLHPAVLNPV